MRNYLVASILMHFSVLIIASIYLSNNQHNYDEFAFIPEIPIELVAEATTNPDANSTKGKRKKAQLKNKKKLQNQATPKINKAANDDKKKNNNNKKKETKESLKPRLLNDSIDNKKLKAYSNPVTSDMATKESLNKLTNEIDKTISELSDTNLNKDSFAPMKANHQKEKITTKKTQLDNSNTDTKHKSTLDDSKFINRITPKLKPKQLRQTKEKKAIPSSATKASKKLKNNKAPKTMNSILKNLQKVEQASKNKNNSNNHQSNQTLKSKNSSSDIVGGRYGETLGISQIDSIRRQIARCWEIPAGARNAYDLLIDIELKIARDGTITSAKIVNKPLLQDRYYKIAAESAKRAVLHPRCKKLKLPMDKYKHWKHMVIRFNPSEML